jgi:carboxyl-terminal processing protease
VPRTNLYLVFAVTIFSIACHWKAGRNRYAGLVSEAIAEVQLRYVEPVEDRKLFESAMSGMLESLDEHSSYMPPEEYARFRSDSIEKHFEGIGISMQIDDGKLIVVTPILNSPAYRAGVESGDQIVAINGKPIKATANSSLMEQARKRLSGPAGSKVQITVVHEGEPEPVVLSIVRGDVKIDSIEGHRRDADGRWVFPLDEHPQIAYVRIDGFGDPTTGRLREVVAGLLADGRMTGLVLDLRGNRGGLLPQAVAISDLFVSSGVIVEIRGRDRSDDETYLATSAGTFPDFPLAVLIDHESASASELTAACLQDAERAVLIGTRTYGKGSVQKLFELEGGESAMRLTTGRYWRRTGKNIHRTAANQSSATDWGVHPNKGFTLELTDEQYLAVAKARLARSTIPSRRPRPAGAEPKPLPPLDDPQLDKAVEYLLSRTDAEK